MCHQADPNVPVEYQASNADYLGSGWSRGHMAAAANHAHDQQEMNETFYLSNIVPQVLNNNIGYVYMYLLQFFFSRFTLCNHLQFLEQIGNFLSLLSHSSR